MSEQNQRSVRTVELDRDLDRWLSQREDGEELVEDLLRSYREEIEDS